MSARQLARRLVIDAAVLSGADARARARIERGETPGRCVRIALAHGTDRSSIDAFRRQLDWAAERFELISFETFQKLCTDRAFALRRPGMLFTFDDGMLSNYEHGARVLEDFGVRGVFFVVPAYSMLSGSEARAFFKASVQGRSAEGELPMTPTQMCELVARGHTIGNHTRTHARLSIVPDAELHDEILTSADQIEQWIARPVDTFAWTFAWDAISPRAYQIIRSRHPFCFSPCPGLVQACEHTPKLIWRTNIEAEADLRLVRFMSSGLGDEIWRSRREKLAAMLDGRSA
ncbi:MAG: polysaccharide deacetylase family protein [Phycisphaerales bacterium]|nr:polysaccharide deacetylase family protein [Phycisphaerales bacterium]